VAVRVSRVLDIEHVERSRSSWGALVLPTPDLAVLTFGSLSRAGQR
jgi:hypothetical protein